MLSILRKTTSSMAKITRSNPNQYDAVENLSAWEFVDASQSDDEDAYSFDGDDVITGAGDVIGGVDEVNGESEPLDVILAVQSLSVSPPMNFPVELTRQGLYGDDEVDEPEEEDDDYDDDVDDEMVPWQLKGRFGKQRITKMGKRGGSKVKKSKRLPIYQNRPGCVYGKHGLGVQHSYI